MAIYGYTKNYKLIKPQFDTDTWHDYVYDNLDTIDAVMSAIYASGNWKGFWTTNTAYVTGDVVIDKDTDTMYKVMFDHTTSEATFAAEQTAHLDYYELWSPNNLAESWAIKTDGKVSNEDYSSKAYAISSGLIDDGSAKEWAIGSASIGNTNEYSAKKYATDAHNDYISMTTNPNVVAVGSNIANVNAVEQSISNVNTVASNVSSVNTVAGVSTDVTAVANVADSVSTVAGNNTNITTVATNISYVNTAATNIEAIKAAPTAATNAANSATDSANSATASATSAQAAQDALNDVQGLIATPIGTIFQSIYVDESLDIARKLNGQLISSTKFTGFRSWLNTVQTSTPNLFTTETNWQAEKTNSKLGQCGKFVVDDTAGTIRLPCVVNAQGLADLSLIGGIKNESLPKPTLILRTNISSSTDTDLDAIYGNDGYTATNPSNTSDNDEYMHRTYTNGNSAYMDIFHSSYQDGAPVQQEAIQYPYCIQVATSVEETLPAIREYKVNNSDYFGKSMYSNVVPGNASWLASNGQYNARTVYPDYYDWLVEQINAGIKGFKGSTGYAWRSQTADLRFWTAIRNPSVGCAVYGGPGIPFAGTVTAINPDGTLDFHEASTGVTYENLVYTESENINNEGTAFGNLKFANDYDFVVNHTDQTFRLPLKNGQEGVFADGVKGNGTTLGLTNGSSYGGVYSNDSSSGGVMGSRAGVYGTTVSTTPSLSGSVLNGNIGVTTDVTKSGLVVDKTVPSGWKLYFYVGDTVQDANVINAGAVLGQLSDKISRTATSDKELVVGWGMPDWNTEVQLSGTSYTATYKCWLISITNIPDIKESFLYINGKLVAKEYGDYAQLQIPLDIGDVVTSNTTFKNTSVYAMKGLSND